jgi:hypothetical protein
MLVFVISSSRYNDSCKGVEAISTGGCATATKAVTWYGKALEDGGHWTSQAIDDTGNAGVSVWADALFALVLALVFLSLRV